MTIASLPIYHEPDALAEIEAMKAQDTAKNDAYQRDKAAWAAERERVRRMTSVEMRVAQWASEAVLRRMTIRRTVYMILRWYVGAVNVGRRLLVMAMMFAATHAGLYVNGDTRRKREGICAGCERRKPKVQRQFWFGRKVVRQYCKGPKACGEVECPDSRLSALWYRLKLRNFSCPLRNWTGTVFRETPGVQPDTQGD